MTRAVVFGYGEVGIRCLAALRARDVAVPLVVTHRADPAEPQWHDSLERFAQDRRIPVLIDDDPDTSRLQRQIAALSPHLLFSFYYRRMLPASILALASDGALNLHGSLLPKFRGRAPINWAILKGERETGVTLHHMTAKPDAGDIVAQSAFAILPDDTALDVFRKVCAAAEGVVYDMVPLLLAGKAPRIPQDLDAGSYFRGRKPEDGRIDWSCSAQQVHDLIRAVAPPYPGALTRWSGLPARILRSLPAPDIAPAFKEPTAFAIADRCYATCGDGAVLRLLQIEIDGAAMPAAQLAQRLRREPLPLLERTPA